MALKDVLRPSVQECVERNGAHLIDISVRGDGGRPVIEVYIDNEAGVTTRLCADVSRSLIEAIDTSGTVRGAYRLEVSSPGIDRPLKYAWQFKKHLGRKVDMLVKAQPDAENKSGVLGSCDDRMVVLEEVKGEPGVQFPLDKVVEIKVKAPW